MDLIHIEGGKPLFGECRIQGSKNAVLPILAATVLVKGVVELDNCPQIADVECMIKLLQSVGCRVCMEGQKVTVDAGCISGSILPERYVSRMRSSVIMMGSMLGRKREVSLSYPGGCVIGKRPIDMHLQGFSQMGIALEEQGNVLTAQAGQLHGGEIYLPFPSVGATENIILAAVLAEGRTIIHGAAREPEITALCEFLCCAGADITTMGNGSCICVEGVKSLYPCSFRIPPDRIVTGTYLLGCMAAGGEICLRGTDAEQLLAVLKVIEQMGGQLFCEAEYIRLKADKRPAPIPYIKTEVYPGYPTDLQSPLLVVLALADGESCMEEDIFENRFRVVPELCKMGAHILQQGNRVFIRGTEYLKGAHVMAGELRGGAALCLAALAAKGESWIENRHFIDRGYEALERDLRSLGGRI